MDKFESEKGNEEPMEYHSTDFSSEWRFSGPNHTNHTNSTTGLSNSMVICKDLVESSSCSSASMVDSFCPPIWDQPTNSQTLGFNDIIAVQNNVKAASNNLGFRKGNLVPSPRIDMSWAPLNSSIPKESLFLSATSPHVILPQSFSNCPTDSGFIERAARFSCFSGGNFGDMANPFCIPESVSPAYPKPPEVFGLPCGQFQKNENEAKPVIGGSGNESDGGDSPLADAAGVGNSVRGNGSKKRKRNGQNNENDQGKGIVEAKMENDNNPTSTINKPKGNQSKEGNQGSDAVKEEYIHVRARRGQATNSHSLAERVRREKISERMKFLQDLVPGCSKVTGKAVMLDEIINYVQSLQRQVEFLSMKLATVNPRLEFNIEGLLTNKDMIHAPVGPSSSLGFAPDMSMPPPPYPHLHPPQPGLNQQHTHPMGESSSSDALRRSINSHLSAMSAVLKDPNPQVPNVWEDELNNIVQMGFNSRTTLDGQE